MSGEDPIINESTSVVQIDSSGLQNGQTQVVYLSTTTIPGQMVTVTDATGFISSPQSILISTVATATVVGNARLRIQQRYGYITLVARDATSWVPVNCNSFPTPSSIAYGGVDATLIEGNTIHSFNIVSSQSAYITTADVVSSAHMYQTAFISSLNVNSFERHISTSLTDPRVTNAGNLRVYGSTIANDTFNVRGNISTGGNVNISGNISSKNGIIYVGGNITSFASIHVQNGTQTSVGSISSFSGANFLLSTTILADVSINGSISTGQVSSLFTSAKNFTVASSIVFGPESAQCVIRNESNFLNFLNAPATTPSISTTYITASNALMTSNIRFESFGPASTISYIRLSSAQIQNADGSLEISSILGSNLSLSALKVKSADTRGITNIASLSMNDTAWKVSSIGTGGTLFGQNTVLSTNLATSAYIEARRVDARLGSFTRFLASSVNVYSSIYLSTNASASLKNTHIVNTGGAIIGTSRALAGDIEVSTIKTDLISSPAYVYFLGASTANLSSGVVSSLTGRHFTTSSLFMTNGTIGQPLQYSTINMSSAWLLTSTFGMSNLPFTASMGLGTYFNQVSFKAASDQTAYYSIIDPRIQTASYLSTPYVNTVAGTGTAGYTGDGGRATLARVGRVISQPASDMRQNLYFGDNTLGWSLRKITSTGTITTVAGNYQFFYGDGRYPTYAALGPKLSVSVPWPGTLIITDASNARLRLVDTNPIITTIAGTGVAGYSGDGGPATLATFRNPGMTVTDSASTIYVADTSNNVIRRIIGSTISRYAGTGASGATGDGGLALSAKMAGPYGVALDSANFLYITDTSNCVVRYVNPTSGIINKLAGTYVAGFSGDGAAAASAELAYPTGITIDPDNNFYICDTGNSRIRRIDAATGFISTIAGNGTESYSGNGGPGWAAAMSSPRGVTSDANGNLYIADTNNNCIRFLNILTGILQTVAGQPPFGGYGGNNTIALASRLSTPTQVAYDTTTQYLYIADEGNRRIRFMDTLAGVLYDYAGNGSPFSYGDSIPASNAVFGSIAGMTADLQNNIYVADGAGNIIRKIDAITGNISSVIGTGAAAFSGNGSLGLASAVSSPTTVVVDRSNNLIFCDTNNHRVRKYFSTTKIVTTIAGTGIADYSGDGGLATAARLNYPRALTVDTTGNIFIGDSSNYRIRRIDAQTGIITTYAGSGLPGIITPGISAKYVMIGLVTALTTDSTNTLYFNDTPTSGIWQVRASDSTIQPFSAISSPSYLGDAGPISSAYFNTPTGLLYDTSGNFIVCDAGNYRIRRTYNYGAPQTPVYLNMNIAFTNYYANSGVASISINGNNFASFNSTMQDSTLALMDVNIYDYPLQNSNPVLGDQTPYIQISQVGNRGYIKLDGGFWMNQVPGQELLQNLVDSNAGITMNTGILRFPYANNSITLQNKFNDVSLRSLNYTGSLINPSDPALKEKIEPASLTTCYLTLESLRLRAYNYIGAYESTFHVRDHTRLGFITSEISNIFPRSVTEIPFEEVWANSTIQTLDISQIKYTHIGVTQRLMQEVSTLEAAVEELSSLRENLRRLATQRNVIH